MYEYVCKNCRKTFSSKKQNRKFCSHKCSSDYVVKTGCGKGKRTEWVKVVCEECGKEEMVQPSRAKKYHCCSVECLSKRNSKKYNQNVTLNCPICGVEYSIRKSKVIHHRTCGKPKCRHEWLVKIRTGSGNARFIQFEDAIKKNSVSERNKSENGYKNSENYKHIVKHYLGLNSVSKIPKGYVVHHKDVNHFNNNPENLVLLPKTTHRILHTYFGNILLSALHTGKMSRDFFFSLCTEEQANFYKQIIDLNIKNQVVVKQGELLEPLEEGNQQPSIYRNIYEGSTTNERVLTDNAEDSNFDTSALPINKDGEDIV